MEKFFPVTRNGHVHISERDFSPMEKIYTTEEDRLEQFLLKIDNLILKGLETDRDTGELDDLFGIRNSVLTRIQTLEKGRQDKSFWKKYFQTYKKS